MPYIARLDRDLMDKEIAALAERLKSLRVREEEWNAGLLNYAITSLILRSCPMGGYTDMNNVIGVLECVKQEFYAKRLGPYERKKESENGPVY